MLCKLNVDQLSVGHTDFSQGGNLKVKCSALRSASVLREGKFGLLKYLNVHLLHSDYTTPQQSWDLRYQNKIFTA